MTDSWDGEIENDSYKLTDSQIVRLFEMAKLLQDCANIQQVAEIKAVMNGDPTFARELWSEFSDEEQEALWVAPSYGGVFTTNERKILKGIGE